MRIDLICCDFATSRLSAKCASGDFASLCHSEAKKDRGGEAGSKDGESGELDEEKEERQAAVGEIIEWRPAAAAAVPILT